MLEMMDVPRTVLCFLFSVLCVEHCSSGIATAKTFRGAVYEHVVIYPTNYYQYVNRSDALKNMMANLNIYKEQAEKASEQNSDIIIFPEDGIYGTGFSRNRIKPYLEFIPDPNQVQWNPCSDPDRYPFTEVQHFLSCLAKNNSIYLVANMGDKQPCSSQCPPDGQFQYNTDVVYDNHGEFIGRYHKQHLFHELQFDTPNTTDFTYFDTEFGRVGVFTCFDIMFHEPAVRLIEQYNITTVAFPTAWIDALPLFTAIQFHAAFAAGMGVNLLAANIHRPSRGFIGSGIYTPLGILNFYYDNMHQQGRLLINDIEVLENRRPSMNLDKYQTSSILHGTSNTDEFTSYLFHDLYNFLPLTNQSGSLKVCQKEVCCHLDYVKAESNDLLAFGAFDGLHTYQGRFYLQVCALVKCASLARNSCGSETNSSSSYFQSFSISGSFSGPYIFPDVLLADQEQLSFPTIGQYTYVNQVLTGSRFAHPLLSAALVSRVYSKDNAH